VERGIRADVVRDPGSFVRAKAAVRKARFEFGVAHDPVPDTEPARAARSLNAAYLSS
jgi:hypothetical protein